MPQVDASGEPGGAAEVVRPNAVSDASAADGTVAVSVPSGAAETVQAAQPASVTGVNVVIGVTLLAAGNTVAEVALSAAVVPDAFVAETRRRTVRVSSLAVSRYVAPLAPGIGTQAAPDGSQASHWYANEVGEPDQLPFVPVSCRPTRAVPERAGSAVLCGGVPAAACTTAVAALSAIAGPAALEAVTRARTVAPWSRATSAYVCAIAPEIAAQPAPAVSQRNHW